MHKGILAGLMGGMLMFSATTQVAAQVAGSTTLGITKTEVAVVAHGWSAKKQVLDKTVYNDKNEKVGEVEDVIIAPDKAISYAIVGVGGFLGMGEHYVAIPFQQLKLHEGKFVLHGASKEALKDLPVFEYAK